MSYLTVAQAQARLARQAAALYNDAGSINTAWLQADIDDVEGYIDGVLGTRYVVPVTATVAANLLRGLALDLLQERAYRRLPSGSVPESVAAAAKQAREVLTSIATGSVSLAGAEAPEAIAPASGLILSGPSPTLDKAGIGGF